MGAFPLSKTAIVFNAGLLVAIKAHEILPTERRSHMSMTLSIAE
jgi:hypothetical protein